MLYTPPLNYFHKNRLNIVNNEINFYFRGNDLEINLFDNNNNIINIKIINNNTNIKYNNTEILEKYTPFLLNNKKNQLYKISVQKNNINIIIENKFNLIKSNILDEEFIINNTEIKTEYGGWWTSMINPTLI